MKVKFIVGFVIIAAAIVWLAATGFKGAKSYYKTVDELSAMGEDAHTYRLKVAGEIVPGSIRRSAGRVDFVITQRGKTLKVSYIGNSPLPDTVVDKAQIVIEGKYRREGDFQADALQAKCASKYQAVNRNPTARPSGM